VSEIWKNIAHVIKKRDSKESFSFVYFIPAAAKGNRFLLVIINTIDSILPCRLTFRILEERCCAREREQKSLRVSCLLTRALRRAKVDFSYSSLQVKKTTAFYLTRVYISYTIDFAFYIYRNVYDKKRGDAARALP
jgi:hypothetical protein